MRRRKRYVRACRTALIHWAQSAGEASDYVDNLPMQCLHPVGHWYEIANLLAQWNARKFAGRRVRT